LCPAPGGKKAIDRIGEIEAGVGAKAEWKFGYGFAIYPDTGGRKREMGWGGIWGTTLFISMVAILLTQRVFDASALAREIELTRLPREAIKRH
jgi:hypothetical protein